MKYTLRTFPYASFVHRLLCLVTAGIVFGPIVPTLLFGVLFTSEMMIRGRTLTFSHPLVLVRVFSELLVFGFGIATGNVVFGFPIGWGHLVFFFIGVVTRR